jgi:cytoskeletal protein RodZ
MGMNETPHPAVVARRRRLHQLRVRIATGVVGLFIAVFSVIYAQTPSTAKTTTSKNRVASATSSSSSSSSSSTSSTTATPMTTSQS